MIQIRKATLEDFDALMSIYEIAREFMRNTGNPNQWKNTNPPAELVKEDIKNGISHIIYDEAGIQGAFSLCEGEDETYFYIEDGQWMNDELRFIVQY